MLVLIFFRKFYNIKSIRQNIMTIKIHTTYGIIVTAVPMIYDQLWNIYISRQYSMLGLEGAFDLWINANIIENLGTFKSTIKYYQSTVAFHRCQTALELDHLHHGHGTLARVQRVAGPQVSRTGGATRPGHPTQEDGTASNIWIGVEEHWIKE